MRAAKGRGESTAVWVEYSIGRREGGFWEVVVTSRSEPASEGSLHLADPVPKWLKIYLLEVKERQKGANSAGEGEAAMLSAGPGSLAGLWNGLTVAARVLRVSSKVAVSRSEGRRTWQCCVRVERCIR